MKPDASQGQPLDRRAVHVVVDVDTEGFTDDDRCFTDALAELGVTPLPLRWDAPLPESGSEPPLLVIRSPWDYVQRPDAFLGWLDELDARGVHAHNSADVMRWNLHKGYLAELADRGVPTVPTTLVPCNRAPRLSDLLREHGWSEGVVKPAVGANSVDTIRTTDLSPGEAQRHLDRLALTGDVLVQPYLTSVAGAGEISVVVIDGTPTHAILKRPTRGDWRVQSDYGGTAERVDLAPTVAALAARVVESAVTSRFGGPPLFARVDLVDLAPGADRENRLAVMELEVIDPELFFRLAPEAAVIMAAALIRRAGGG